MYKTQLKTSLLGATGLEITRVGFGAWAIGGGGSRSRRRPAGQGRGTALRATRHRRPLRGPGADSRNTRQDNRAGDAGRPAAGSGQNAP